jgi:dihydropyrimidine dehydrogenase (NADP+)
LRANDEIFEPGRYEGINFIPYSTPKNFELNKDGSVKAINFKKNLPSSNDPENLKYKESEQDFTLDCDGVITAFGCKVPENEEWLNEIKLTKGIVKIDKSTYQSNFIEWLFAGGDIVGTANLVDAVNDGKTASWYMHKYIQ